MPQVKGLEGVVAAETELSLVDGERGHLVYRGYWAKDLAMKYTYEEVAHLLWVGHLPNANELEQIQNGLKQHRVLPDYIKEIIDRIPSDQDMMSVLRTAVSAMGVTVQWPPSPEEAYRFTGAMPSIVAYRHAKATGRTPVEPRHDLSHVANYLYMLTGETPSADKVKALEAYLIITMEHGMNASTFTARVVTSTQSDMASALSAALGAMKGPLHGGAPSEVMDMLEDIKTPANAEAWVRGALERGERLMGFGHRVYKTRDPRALALREVVEHMRSDDPWFELSVHVEDTAIRLLDEYKPGRRLYTNVEYWAAAILRTVEIPKSIYTPTFSISRTVGWTAHMIEQSANNRLIRPQSTYVGPFPE